MKKGIETEKTTESENYNLGEVEGLEKNCCVYCGEKVEEGRLLDGRFPVCEEDRSKRVEPRTRAEEFADSLDEPLLTGEKLDEYFRFLKDVPGPVPPKCIYCGKLMKVLKEVIAGSRVDFIWVCPDKHWNLVTGSPGGIG